MAAQKSEGGGLTGLASHTFLTEYRSKKEDPAKQFYTPCIRLANRYRRAVGYFRSTVYVVVGHSVIEFARRGGKIHLICSPQLDADDIDAITLGYAHRSDRVAEALVREFDGLLADTALSYGARVLATLIASGSLDIKLAIRSDRKGLYHEKIGIFSDEFGGEVSFKGSANETWNGWDDDGNFESIEVFCSWRGGLEQKRVDRHRQHFDRLWSEQDDDVEVFEFPANAAEHLKKAAFASLEKLPLEDIALSQLKRSPMKHQLDAVSLWEQAGRRGIFEHATGSGKTFTAIIILREHTAKGLPAIVVVPSQLLLEQWAAEIRTEIPEVAIMLAGAGHTRWKLNGRLQSMTDSDSSFGGRITVATMQTASSKAFRDAVASGDHLLLVADEVHQVGSPQNFKLTDIAASSRLGLSATPERFGDPDGTRNLLSYFGDVVPPPITLNDAIAAGRLVPYEYHPHLVSLNAEEADEWRTITNSIRQEIAKSGTDESGQRNLNEKTKLLLIKRSRIAKNASAKVDLASEVLSFNYEDGQSWLIYCEDSSQLRKVMQSLERVGLKSSEYHSNMEGDRLATLAWFRRFGGILVSVRCLDEGVDIPAVSHALILASSQNPRQFIQRRGRVLRKFPGKHIAVVHDALVVPVNLAEEPEQTSLLKSELLRAEEFARNAINLSAAGDLREAAAKLRVDMAALDRAFGRSGIEEEETE